MAADPIISNATAIIACNAITALLNGGTIKVYTVGSGIPADVDVAITDQVLLAELTYSNPAFGAAVDGGGKATATANAITADPAANADGTAAFFRSFKSDGTAVKQGTCGAAAADLILNTVTVVTGAEVSVTAETFSVPEQL